MNYPTSKPAFFTNVRGDYGLNYVEHRDAHAVVAFFEGEEYSLSPDNDGRLQLRTTNGAIIMQPEVTNCVTLIPSERKRSALLGTIVESTTHFDRERVQELLRGALEARGTKRRELVERALSALGAEGEI